MYVHTSDNTKLQATTINAIEKIFLSKSSLKEWRYFDPTCAPKKDPDANAIPKKYSGCSKIIWVPSPVAELNSNVNWEVGLAFIIFISKIITKIGTKIIPPPTPKKLEIMPAVNVPITNSG